MRNNTLKHVMLAPIVAAACTLTATPCHAGDIVDTASNAGSFETLITAVRTAGLTETLQGDGPFAVFAPTDDAFAALPEGTLDTLLADPEGALTDVLLYHVVAGKAMAADVVGMESGSMVETAGGNSFALTIEDGKVKGRIVFKPDEL